MDGQIVQGRTEPREHKAHPTDAEDITVSAVAMAWINSRKYVGMVLDLLEWSAPQKAKHKRKPAAKAKKQNKSASKGEKQKVRISARLYDIIYCSYIYWRYYVQI